MKYISLAAHNNELIVIDSMDTFTVHFCYSKKQRHGKIDIIPPAMIDADDADVPVPTLEIEEVEVTDEDDI